MGMDWHWSSNQNESWTNEKHVHFLNSMEAWFVHTMLENNGRCNLRLDRHLPDSSESTRDCRQITRNKHATSDFTGTSTSTRREKRSRRPSSQPHDHSSQDQVVPQNGNKTDEKDLPNVPAASMAPAN